MIKFVLECFGMFCLAIIVDVLWAFYDVNLAKKDFHKAGIYSVAMGTCTWLFTLMTIENSYAGLFYIIGLYLGTRIAGRLLK
jgi:hypothetical protein